MKRLQNTSQKLASLYRSFSTQNYRPDLRVLAAVNFGKKPQYMSLADAISIVKPDSDIFVHGSTSTPIELCQEICDQVESGRLDKIRLSHVLLQEKLPWEKPQLYGKIRSNCLFISPNLRSMVNKGVADYTPISLSEMPALFLRKLIPVDVALIMVSPLDERGYCSLGLNLTCGFDALRVAKKIIAVVNSTMPFTYGDAVIHSSHFDAMVRSDRQIFVTGEEEKIGEVERKCGTLIAENLVDNEATLQVGIGAIPDSALSAMKNHKDLGIHSELLGNGVMKLIKQGVITGAKKTLDPGKVIASFAVGSKAFNDFVHKNPMFEFRSCTYTNNSDIIRQHRKMTAINSALEIDLTGQVCSDSIGTRMYSGPGGQVDFMYGTSLADDGESKAIIAFPSTTAKGASKIVPMLQPGAGVVTIRSQVRYVVTEYGIAQLWGRNVRQRAYDLIRISHPNHRESLEKAAFEMLKCMPSNDP